MHIVALINSYLINSVILYIQESFEEMDNGKQTSNINKHNEINIIIINVS